METCAEHSQLVSQVGELNGKTSLVLDSLKGLDQKIDHQVSIIFSVMEKNRIEFKNYRSKIIQLETRARMSKEIRVNDNRRISLWVSILLGVPGFVSMVYLIINNT